MILLFLALAAVSPGVSAPPAGTASPAVPVPQPAFVGEIVIGATFPLSGPLETYGQSAYYGAVTRIKMINDAGGIHGKKLVVQWRDNGSSAKQAVRDVEELATKYRVPLILGPLLSEAVMAARLTAYHLGVVLLTPMATIDAATAGNPWIFRATFTSSAEAKGMVRFQMEKYGAKTCAILYDTRFVFSQEMSYVFSSAFNTAGGKVLATKSFSDPMGNKDYASALKALAAMKPDFIFAPCYALEATEIIQAARDLKIGVRFCGPDTWDNQLVFEASGSRLASTAFTSALYEKTFSYRPFQTFFTAMEKAGMDTPDAQAACAFDAVSMIAAALENGETPEKVRQGLLKIDRLRLATGRVTMTPDGNPLKPVLIRVVEKSEGRLVPVYAERYDP